MEQITQAITQPEGSIGRHSLVAPAHGIPPKLAKASEPIKEEAPDSEPAKDAEEAPESTTDKDARVAPELVKEESPQE